MQTTSKECRTDTKFLIKYKDVKSGNITNLFVYTLSDALKHSKEIRSEGHEILARKKIVETNNLKKNVIVTTW